MLVDSLCKGCDRLHDVLAAVEHQKKLPVAERFNHSRSGIFDRNEQAERSRCSARDEVRVLETPEIEEADAVSELVSKLMREGDGDRCLTDASRPTKSDEPARGQVLGQREDVHVPPDDPDRQGRKGRIWSSIPRVRQLVR